MLAIKNVSPVEHAPSAAVSAHLTATMPAEQMEQLRATAATLAATDPIFRASLMHNPKETLSMLIGINSANTYELPKALEVIALEEPAGTTGIVIPSSDKAAYSTSELAALSRELAANPQLLASLTKSPRVTLEAFLQRNDAPAIRLPEDTTLHIFREEPGELIVIVPTQKPLSPMAVQPNELASLSELQSHMSCITCQCISAANCITGQCITASNCVSWSNGPCN